MYKMPHLPFEDDKKHYRFVNGELRKAFRISTLVMHIIIVGLSIVFTLQDLPVVLRKNLIKSDWKYVEFIERIYNDNKPIDEYNLEILGSYEKVSKPEYKEEKSFFGLQHSAKTIFGFKARDGLDKTFKNFFEEVNALESSEFISPLMLYKKNMHIYALPGELCHGEPNCSGSIGPANKDVAHKILSRAIPDTDLLVRFCMPSVDPFTDFQFCYKSIKRHKILMIWLFAQTVIFTVLYPFAFLLMYQSSKKQVAANENRDTDPAKTFHLIEDFISCSDVLFLAALSMDVSSGFPSGFPNTRCTHDQTGLYNFYIMFNTIYVMLVLLFTIAVISNILDFIWYNNVPDNFGTHIFWNTRRHEIYLQNYSQDDGAAESVASNSNGSMRGSIGRFSSSAPSENSFHLSNGGYQPANQQQSIQNGYYT